MTGEKRVWSVAAAGPIPSPVQRVFGQCRQRSYRYFSGTWLAVDPQERTTVFEVPWGRIESGPYGHFSWEFPKGSSADLPYTFRLINSSCTIEDRHGGEPVSTEVVKRT
jgi:hypothetical protein